MRRQEWTSEGAEVVAYAGAPMAVVVNRELRDDYVTANIVASFGGTPDLGSMPFVPLHALVETVTPLARPADLAGVAESPAAVEDLVRRQATFLAHHGRATLLGDFAVFEAYVARMLEEGGHPALDWWASPSLRLLVERQGHGRD